MLLGVPLFWDPYFLQDCLFRCGEVFQMSLSWRENRNCENPPRCRGAWVFLSVHGFMFLLWAQVGTLVLFLLFFSCISWHLAVPLRFLKLDRIKWQNLLSYGKIQLICQRKLSQNLLAGGAGAAGRTCRFQHASQRGGLTTWATQLISPRRAPLNLNTNSPNPLENGRIQHLRALFRVVLLNVLQRSSWPRYFRKTWPCLISGKL